MTFSNFHDTFITLHRYYLTAVCCLFIAFSVVFEDSYNITALLLLTTYIGFFSPKIRRAIQLGLLEKALISISLLYSASFFMELLIFDEKPRIVEEAVKTLALIPLIFLLNAVSINRKHIILAFILSCFLLFIYTSYDIFINNYSRAGYLINPIQFGVISIAIASVTLALKTTLYTEKKGMTYLTILSGVIALCGVMAGIMTQSRGSIIALPIVGIVILLLYCDRFNFGKMKVIFFIIATLSLGTITISQSTTTLDRFKNAINNTSAYYSGENTNTSTGVRLGQWQNAFEAGLKSPLLGIGRKEYVEYKNKQVEAGKFGKELLKFDNTHNSYLDAFARRGAIGLIAVIIFLGFPIYAGIATWRKNNQNSPYSAALIVLGVVFMISNITQEVIFLSTGAIMYYGLLVILTNMLCKASTEKKASCL